MPLSIFRDKREHGVKSSLFPQKVIYYTLYKYSDQGIE